VFVLRVRGGNIGTEIECYCVFFERVCEGQYREKLIFNITLLLLRVWGGNIEKN